MNFDTNQTRKTFHKTKKTFQHQYTETFFNEKRKNHSIFSVYSEGFTP